jgi:hypothetical protein
MPQSDAPERGNALDRASVMSPEMAVAVQPQLSRKHRPNADPTRVPSPAFWCTQRFESEYAVPANARPCTPLGRPGNAVYRVKRYRGFESLSVRISSVG